VQWCTRGAESVGALSAATSVDGRRGGVAERTRGSISFAIASTLDAHAPSTEINHVPYIDYYRLLHVCSSPVVRYLCLAIRLGGDFVLSADPREESDRRIPLPPLPERTYDQLASHDTREAYSSARALECTHTRPTRAPAPVLACPSPTPSSGRTPRANVRTRALNQRRALV
jgi:hypothetical protein